jgi:hypothetical protein
MDTSIHNELFLDAVDTVVLDVLERIGDDPSARYAFFRRLVAVAMKAAESDPDPIAGVPVSPAELC